MFEFHFSCNAQELDIENDDIRGGGLGLGPPQYTDADILVPESDIGTKEEEERQNLTQVLLGPDVVKQERRKDEVEMNNDKDSIIDYGSSMEQGSSHSVEELKQTIVSLRRESSVLRQNCLCNICLNSYATPVVATVCWHVHCEQCWLRALGTKKLCPQCKVIVQPNDLRKIYL